MTLNYIVFRYAFLAAAFLAVCIAVYAVASAPTRIASRLGMRGLKRRWAVEGNPGWASLEPMVRWLGVRVSGMVSDSVRSRVDAMIALAGDYLGLTPDEFFSLSVLSSIFGAIFGVLMAILADGSVGAFMLVGLMLGAVLPYFQTSGEAARRLRQIN
ncbi:MAG TPA: hypothetical protein VLS89_05720, partial [Candidatus Nanopelagicales bacterium]|nr:hypothetical protein [Candidatus Nanopelagicales bacterium]